MRRLLLLNVIAAIFFATAAFAAVPFESRRATPYVVNLALPRPLLPAASDSAVNEREQLEEEIRKSFQTLYCARGHCPELRVHINVALGNDYQILDWLAKGWVDSAIVPSLSIYLLARDGLELREVDVSALGAVVPAAQPETRAVSALALEPFLRQIWDRAATSPHAENTGSEPAPCKLVLSSHFGAHDFLPVLAAAGAWLDRQRADTEVVNRFWREFFDQIRFALGAAPPLKEGERACTWPAAAAPQRPRTLQALLASYDYHLVITSARANALFGDKLPRATARLSRDVLELFAPEREQLPDALRSFLVPEPAFGARPFSFTIEESMELLRQQQHPENNLLALILPGGGVKAGFQTRILEHLYGARHLKNYTISAASPGASSHRDPLGVDYIIGTSGGALLGFFAAQLGEKPPMKLSRILWTRDDRVLRSTDVFGYFDLLRYLTFVVIFGLFCLAVFSFQQRDSAVADTGKTMHRWRVRLLLAIGPVLLLTPLLVRYVNGATAQEHIPEIEGFFYAVFAFIAMFADQCLLLDEEGEPEPRWKAPLATVLVITGTLLAGAMLAFRYRSPEHPWVSELATFYGSLAIQPAALLFCAGVLCLLLGSLLWTGASSRYREVGGRPFLAGAVCVPLLHIALVYTALWLATLLFPNSLSFLELTLEFWLGLIIASLALALAVRWLASRGRLPGFLKEGLQFLSAQHPTSQLRSRRFSRLWLLALLSFAWWNFVIAPALYGNKHARDSFTQANLAFDRVYDNSGSPTYLTARLIIPANVLERDGTRYFLFAPAESDCPKSVRREGVGVEWRRYFVTGNRGDKTSLKIKTCDEGEQPGDNLENIDIEKVVFASGSPFPVFPAHTVGKESLVDGGYSNNIPIDAAHSVSAGSALIIESSHPLGHQAGPLRRVWDWAMRLPGALITNLPRVLAFLYDRSQQMDRLSRSDLFVVSLAPPRDEAGWPSLVDFRPGTIERMQEVAEKNLARRIGLVQSWGRPRFELTVRIGERRGRRSD